MHLTAKFLCLALLQPALSAVLPRDDSTGPATGQITIQGLEVVPDGEGGLSQEFTFSDNIANGIATCSINDQLASSPQSDPNAVAIGLDQPCNPRTFQYQFSRWASIHDFDLQVAHTITKASTGEVSVINGTLTAKCNDAFGCVYDQSISGVIAPAPAGWIGDPY